MRFSGKHNPLVVCTAMPADDAAFTWKIDLDHMGVDYTHTMLRLHTGQHELND